MKLKFFNSNLPLNVSDFINHLNITTFHQNLYLLFFGDSETKVSMFCLLLSSSGNKIVLSQS
jgi:hypothetical protein